MAKRLAELGALQDAVSNDESSPKRLALAGYIRGLFLDWSANPYNPLSRLTARGRLLGYFWDSGAIGLSMNFADQNYLVKDGTVQSKSFSQIVNFSRTTNATVTNSAGLITYAPHNLLTHSEQFDNAAWGGSNRTITANSILAPNNTQTADTITRNLTTTNAAECRFTTTQAVSTTYTLSVYAKVGTTGNLLYLRNIAVDSTLTTGLVKFNLTTGVADLTLGATYTGKTSITSIGNGWYRCSITGTTASTITNNLVDIGCTSSSTIGGTNGDFLYAWGAQLEVGASPTTYNPTTVKNLLGYSELFDNAAWTKSNSFVQTNLLTYSEQFDNAAWTKVSATITANSIVAPNGYQTADTFIPNSASAGYITSGATVIATTTTATASIYFQAAGLDQFSYFYGGLSADRVGVTVTLSNNTITNYITGTGTNPSSSSITPVGNGWYRLVFTFTTPSANNVMVIRYLGSTTANGTNGVYLWGAQLVQGSVAGDYRRTDSTSLPVYYPNHNGVVCAEKLVENTATNSHFIQQNVTGLVVGGTYSWSVYVKSGGRAFYAAVLADNAVFYTTYFNLDTGNLGTVPAGITASIVNVGNGWYRCSITRTVAATAVNFYPSIASANGVSSYTGDGTSGIYIFGAQLSDSASLDPYVLNAAAAPTAAAYYGARFDYDPVTLAPKGLLIEEQRTNLRLYSEDFRNTADAGATRPTVYSNATVSSIATTNPYGVSGTYKIIEDTANAEHLIYFTSVLTAAGYSNSIYVKADTRSKVRVGLATSGFAYGASVIADLSAGTLSAITQYGGHTGATASIEARANGWYRVVINITGTANTFVSSLTLVTGTSTTLYTGDGTSGIYIWGAQLEAGAFATSYIPTAASQVTRAADVATIQGSNFYSWYNQNEGSVVTNAQKISTISDAPRIYSISDGSNSNRITEIAYTSNLFFVSANGSTQADLDSGDYQQAVFAKQANAYKVNEFASAFNNGTVATDVSGITPIVNRLNLGVDGDLATGRLSGHIKQISYYPQKLSDSVLKGLTA